MKNTFKKIMSFTVAAALTVGAVFSLASCKKNDSETIKIGLSAPLTGGAAQYGIAVRNSAQLAIDEINAITMNDGELGLKFELLAYNDEHKKENVTTTYSSMYEKGMHMSLGTVTTAPGLEFKEMSNDDNVFVLTPSATGDAIVEDYDNAYQMCFSDNNQGTASAKFFNDNYQGNKIGVFYKSDDEYSTGIYEKFMAALDDSFKNAGVTAAAFSGDGLVFDTQIDTLKGCDVIFLPIYSEPAAAFMKSGVGKIANSAVYYGCDGLDGIEAKFGTMDEFMAIPQEVSFLSHFNSSATSGPAYDFVQKYNAKYDEDKEPVNQFGAAAYDCVYAIYDALKFAKSSGEEFDYNTSASDYCEILKAVFNNSDFVFHGVTGKCDGNNKSNISWTSDGFVNKEAVKYVVKESNK